MKILSSAALAAMVLLLPAVQAQAATVQTYCPGTAGTGDREFTVTTEAPGSTCIGFGVGNINGNPAQDPIFALLAPGAGLLDKTDDGSDPIGSVVLDLTGVNSLAGIWAIIVPTGYTLINAVLGFKSGQGQLDPDWAAFSLPDGILAGSWSIAAGSQSLSHANLYGELVPATVPVPAAGFLLIGALGGLSLLRRRKATSL